MAEFKKENVRFMWEENEKVFYGYCADTIHDLKKKVEEGDTPQCIRRSDPVAINATVYPFTNDDNYYTFAYAVPHNKKVKVGSVWLCKGDLTVAMVTAVTGDGDVVVGNVKWERPDFFECWEEYVE